MSEVKKIAFLFLVYDEINQEYLWERFFENVDPNKYSVYVHYKTNNVRSEFFDRYKLDQCVPTQYCHISIIEAHKLLLQTGLQDPLNVKFINLSQACIPLKSFDHVYEKLTRDEASYFNLMPAKHIFPRCDVLLSKGFTREQVKKASEWFILNRAHAQLCVDTSHEAYKDVYCPEENFFITTLGDVRENLVITDNEAHTATTFTNWEGIGMNYPYPGGNPKTYTEISTEELNFLLDSPALFGRKFAQHCSNLVEGVVQHL